MKHSTKQKTEENSFNKYVIIALLFSLFFLLSLNSVSADEPCELNDEQILNLVMSQTLPEAMLINLLEEKCPQMITGIPVINLDLQDIRLQKKLIRNTENLMDKIDRSIEDGASRKKTNQLKE